MDPEDSMRRTLQAQRYRAESLEDRDARAGHIWWEELNPGQKSHWMKRAQSNVPARCWEAYKRETRE